KDAKDRGAKVDVILGDGRLTIKRAPERYYQAIVLDAFSGDAIPVHLLTEEAVQLYLSKLTDGGVLIFNATNRFVDIRPVLADLADRNGLTCYTFPDALPPLEDDEPDDSPVRKMHRRYFYVHSSDWIVLQRKQEVFITGEKAGWPMYTPNFKGL